LKIAREVDPEGNRIIGVLTNVDKVTGHTERMEKIVKVINNEIIPLKHGFFGVANRSQQQVDDKIPVKMSADMFEELIEDCSEYQDLKHRLGINNLVSFLGNSLANLVQQGWPKIKQELKQRHKVIENELRAMEGECNNQSMRSLRMITVLQKLEKEIRISIEGSSTCVNLEKVAIGAQMNFLIKEGAVKISENVRNTFAEEELSLMIANADMNCYGARDQAMIPREVLEIAVRILTEPYIGNTKRLTDSVAENLLQSCSESADRILDGNVKLTSIVKCIFSDTILKLKDQTNGILTTLIESHYEFLNLEHPQFRETAQKYLGVFHRFPPTHGWFLNTNNQNDAYDAFLTLEEDDRKSPSSNSSSSADISTQSCKDTKPKCENQSTQKKKFFTRRPNNETRFYDVENDEKLGNVVQVREDTGNTRIKDDRQEMMIPTTQDGRLYLIKLLVKKYMDIVDEALMDMIPKIILKCMVYKFRTDMSEGSCILNRIKGDGKEEELLAVDTTRVLHLEKLQREDEKLVKCREIMESFKPMFS